MKKKRMLLKKNIGQFPVIVQEDVAGGYWVSCPSLEGCYSQGETVDEALTNIQDAILLCLEDFPRKQKQILASTSVSLHLVTV